MLNERAAKEAADRAAKEQATPEPSAAAAGDITGSSGFIDTRLAFTLTNENLLVKPGETIPSVPGWRFGTPNSLGVLFFDNYDTRYSGFETLSHAVDVPRLPQGPLRRRGRLRAPHQRAVGEEHRALATTAATSRCRTGRTRRTRIRRASSLTAFPVSADRFRLGYSYRLSWGGNPEYGRAKSATPGVKLQYDTENALRVRRRQERGRARPPHRRAEVARSRSSAAPASTPTDDAPASRSTAATSTAATTSSSTSTTRRCSCSAPRRRSRSTRACRSQSSVDYKLYKNNGERVSGLFDPVKYPGGAVVAREGGVHGPRPDARRIPTRPARPRSRSGTAGDLNVRVMIDRVRLRLDASYRDLAFILHSLPSLPTY